MSCFEKDLEILINKHGQENGSNTPDFVLARYLNNCLQAFDDASLLREQWYGHRHRPGGVVIPADVPNEGEQP